MDNPYRNIHEHCPSKSSRLKFARALDRTSRQFFSPDRAVVQWSPEKLLAHIRSQSLSCVYCSVQEFIYSALFYKLLSVNSIFGSFLRYFACINRSFGGPSPAIAGVLEECYLQLPEFRRTATCNYRKFWRTFIWTYLEFWETVIAGNKWFCRKETKSHI